MNCSKLIFKLLLNCYLTYQSNCVGTYGSCTGKPTDVTDRSRSRSARTRGVSTGPRGTVRDGTVEGNVREAVVRGLVSIMLRCNGD